MSVRTLRYNTATQHFAKSALASTDRDALAFLEAAQIYNTNQQRAIVNLVRSLKRVGLWSKMKAIYPFIGGTASTHKWNLKDPRDLDAAFRLTFSGGITHSSQGIQGNGTTGYANTYLIPSSELNSSSAHISAYVRTNQARNEIDMSTYGSSDPGFLALISRWGDNRSEVYMWNWQTNFVTNSNHLDSRGFYIGSRSSNTSLKMFKNGLQFGSETTATSANFNLLTRSVFICARNLFGNGDSYSSKQYAFATIGDGLTDTDATNLYNIVDLYQKRLGRAV